jgi:hypothetical protein
MTMASSRIASPSLASKATMPSAISPAMQGRDLRLDFFRGLSLWFIFLDHVPSNLIAWVTVRNFGFSDASEIFVFISGYTAAFVYGRVMNERGFIIGAARILKRAWQIYVAFVFLFVFYVAEISYLATRFQNPLYTEESGFFAFLQKPEVILIEALKLHFLPANVDVLPLYIVLMAFFPLVLWPLLRWPNVTLAASIVFYAFARILDWNISLYPDNRHWFFNPYCWQLLFVIGGWCALGGVERIEKFLKSRTVLVLSIIFLVYAAALQLSWIFPGFTRKLPTWALILPLNKSDLSLFRLFHFLALANIVVRFIPMDAAFLRSAWAKPVLLCGQNSLEIFCLGVFLSFSAHFFITEISARLPFQMLVSFSGICIMVAVAAVMTWYKNIDKRGRKPPPPQPNLGERTT